MSVYIEYVVADNYLMTYLIAKLACASLKISVTKKRLHLACVIGTLGAVCYPFVKSIILTVLFKVALWLVLSIILFYKKPRFFVSSLVFLLVTATVAGIVLMLTLSSAGQAKYEYFLSIYGVPAAIIVLPALFALWVLKKLVLKINRVIDARHLEYDAQFGYCGAVGSVRCFLDTGNRLIDERSGLPIVVMGADKFFATLSIEALNRYIQEGRQLIYSAVGGTAKMTLIKPEYFRLYSERGENIFIDVMIGIVMGKLHGGYDAILPPSVIN